MTADRPPWVGTVTTPELPSLLEVQPRGAGDAEVILFVAAVAAAPDAPQRGDGKICSCSSSRYVSLAFCCRVDLLGACLPRLIIVLPHRHS
jgi:hypothetical protein